ncbi:MAG: hypothetical protein LWY06_10160 [Firmicutes bacterium]|nr:hypothetical protein [Bacillota bacterium]
MDSISSAAFNHVPVQPKTSGIKKNETPSEPSDNVSISAGESKREKSVKSGTRNWQAAVLDIRVPTVTKNFPETDTELIMNSIKPGDIILETNNAYPSWQVLGKAVFNSNYTHAAIYEGDGQFIEATTTDPDGRGVIRTDLRKYLEGRIKLEVLRPPYKSEEDKKAALDYARAQLGKPYDAKLNQEDDKEFYCTELVQKALASMPNPIDVPITSFFGHKAVSPAAFQKIPGVETVYTSNSNFWTAMASHFPVYLGAAAGATTGGSIMGSLGAFGGFIAGGILTTMTGNKIQAGKFSLYPEAPTPNQVI